MKRVIAAAVILVLVAAMSFVSVRYQTYNTNKLLKMLDEMKSSFDSKDYETCLEQTYTFTDEFQKRTKYFPFFMRHSDISSIEESVVTLPVMLEEDDVQHFAVEMTKCRTKIEKLGDMENITPDNIL